MIELGFKKVMRYSKANNFKGRLQLSWFHTKAIWYCLRYGGAKITDDSPNYITEDHARDLIIHLATKLEEKRNESK